MQSLSSLFWKSVHSGDVVVEGQTKMKSHLNKKFNHSNLRSLPEASWLISLGEFIQYASLHFIQRRRKSSWIALQEVTTMTEALQSNTSTHFIYKHWLL